MDSLISIREIGGGSVLKRTSASRSETPARRYRGQDTQIVVLDYVDPSTDRESILWVCLGSIRLFEEVRHWRRGIEPVVVSVRVNDSRLWMLAYSFAPIPNLSCQPSWALCCGPWTCLGMGPSDARLQIVVTQHRLKIVGVVGLPNNPNCAIGH